MADVKRKFVYRVSSGEVVTESLETSDDDSIFKPDPLGQFALAKITMSEAMFDIPRPWFTDGTTVRQATAQESAAFPAAVAADEFEYEKYKLKSGGNLCRVFQETIRLAVNHNLPAAQQLSESTVLSLYETAVDGLT